MRPTRPRNHLRLVLLPPTQIALSFLWLAIGAAVCSYLQASMWMLVGSRVATRMRTRYLSSVLRQDIAFYDTQATTGEESEVAQWHCFVPLLRRAGSAAWGMCLRRGSARTGVWGQAGRGAGHLVQRAPGGAQGPSIAAYDTQATTA